jgi:hypothetical protein
MSQVKVDYTGFHPGHSPPVVDLEDLVHPGSHDHHRVVTGHRTAGQTGTGPPGHEGATVRPGSLDTTDDLTGGLRKANRPRPATLNDQAVTAVEPPSRRAVGDPIRAEDLH